MFFLFFSLLPLLARENSCHIHAIGFFFRPTYFSRRTCHTIRVRKQFPQSREVLPRHVVLGLHSRVPFYSPCFHPPLTSPVLPSYPIFPFCFNIVFLSHSFLSPLAVWIRDFPLAVNSFCFIRSVSIFYVFSPFPPFDLPRFVRL